MSMFSFLTMTTGDRVGSHFLLDRDVENRVGRDSANQVVLTDPHSSRVHCVLRNEGGGWRVIDKSRNGTFVNGQKIDDAMLGEGHLLRIGATEFAFHQSELRPTTLEKLEDLSPQHDGFELEALHLRSPGQKLEPNQTPGDTENDLPLLYQLSLTLLQARESGEVLRSALEVIHGRTRATLAGYLCMNDLGELLPRQTFPPDSDSAGAEMSDSLTAVVAKERRAVWLTGQQMAKPPTSESLASFSDAICVPLIRGDEVTGALHLYKSKGRFRATDLEFSVSVGYIVSSALSRTLDEERLNCDLHRIKAQFGALDEIIGNCAPMRELKERISKIARASGCTLIRGESGTGKELVARALHRSGPRQARPMLAVNCAAIPESLLESHLFGHVAGAFTGADQDHTGLFEQADMSTLFLDEIGELPPEGQAKLLRVLEGHPFQPVGGGRDIHVDVRVIAATNQPLETLVREREFREDLFYRLAVFELRVPPLRERGEDIDLLIDHFLEHFRIQHGRPGLDITPNARKKLRAYTWPGNVRQLRNVIDSAVVLSTGEHISPEDLPLRDVETDAWDSLRIADWEKRLIVEALRRCEGSVQDAAELLGIGRATLYRKIEEYKIARD